MNRLSIICLTGPSVGLLRDPPGVCALLELLKPEVECICLAGFYHLSFICVTSFKQLDRDVITIIIEPPGDLHNLTRCPCR